MRLTDVQGVTGPSVAAALMLCACSPSAENAVAEGNGLGNAAATSFANRMAGVQPPPSKAEPFERSDKTDALEFVYAWPAQASAVREIAEKFRKEMTAGRADALKWRGKIARRRRGPAFPSMPIVWKRAGP